MGVTIIATQTERATTEKAGFLNWTYEDSELVIGLVGAVGTDQQQVINILSERLQAYRYTVEVISVSKDVIAKMMGPVDAGNEFQRISLYMDRGNEARKISEDSSILAYGIASEIYERRESGKPRPRKAYIVNSLKHPSEVELLREIYSTGFFLFGIHSDETRRLSYLIEDKRIPKSDAETLLERDMSEETGHGQQTRDTFQLADFFIHLDANSDQAKKSLWRTLDLIFGHPHLTPTFEEFAMFSAFTASLRTADLSRQVGAVISRGDEIIASGTNDAPKFGGGLYWPVYDKSSSGIVDTEKGRDYIRGFDSNKHEQARIIDEISELLELNEDSKEKLRNSSIRDITEYGRIVHAEMEALLMCARNHISARGATLYCTTFPCHNCAKHIIASGINQVVYIEPYPKSKAFTFHEDAITESPTDNKVLFRPFVGIGPRRFFELFSMTMGSGSKKKRKDKTGESIKWDPSIANMRTQLLPFNYIEIELSASDKYLTKLEMIQGENRTKTSSSGDEPGK